MKKSKFVSVLELLEDDIEKAFKKRGYKITFFRYDNIIFPPKKLSDREMSGSGRWVIVAEPKKR